jgi:hypothetical protein
VEEGRTAALPVARGEEERDLGDERCGVMAVKGDDKVGGLGTR